MAPAKPFYLASLHSYDDGDYITKREIAEIEGRWQNIWAIIVEIFKKYKGKVLL